MTYQTTPKQEQAIREWLQEAIIPLIEQLLVKKLGQAMSFAAKQVVHPKRQPLTYVELRRIANDCGLGSSNVTARTQVAVDSLARAIEAAHGIKENT